MHVRNYPHSARTIDIKVNVYGEDIYNKSIGLIHLIYNTCIVPKCQSVSSEQIGRLIWHARLTLYTSVIRKLTTSKFLFTVVGQLNGLVCRHYRKNIRLKTHEDRNRPNLRSLQKNRGPILHTTKKQ